MEEPLARYAEKNIPAACRAEDRPDASERRLPQRAANKVLKCAGRRGG